METIDHKICRLIRYYERIVGTRDPIAIAKFADIGIAIMPLGDVVIAHELGHALLHRKENCAFLQNHTLLLTSGIEREANQFAAELLISDDMLQNYSGHTSDQFCACTGYPKELLKLKLL